MNNLDPDVWLPHFWFFFYTVAHSYPVFPNAVTKRKYYDFVQNLPLFIPHDRVRKIIIQILNDTMLNVPLWNGKRFSQTEKKIVSCDLVRTERISRFLNLIKNKKFVPENELIEIR